MPYQDKTLICKDCGRTFTWSAKEQEFFASKGFQPPLRCPEDREKRRMEREQSKKGITKHEGLVELVCSNCKKQGKVPFKPANSSSVFCAECFERLFKTSRTN